eukprot:scaffold29960_cov31-Attheya_sp.AAC.1
MDDTVLATIHSSKIDQVITCPDSSSDIKTTTDKIDNRIDCSNFTALQFFTDIYNHIDDVYHPVTSDFTDEVPEIKINTMAPSKLAPVEALPSAPPSPPTKDVDFPHFSCYMGTGTNIHPTVSPADFSKFLLPARTSATGSYVDHKIPLLTIFHVSNFMNITGSTF